MPRPYRVPQKAKSTVRRSPTDAPSPSAQAASRPPGPCSILLVDDDPGVRTSLRRLLALEGWQVCTAATGEEALEQLTRTQPDLLITDLCMAEVSGWDLLFHENLQRPRMPIFVITALPPPAAGGADQFAAEFFQKPLDLEVLVAAIHRCLDPVGPAPSASRS